MIFGGVGLGTFPLTGAFSKLSTDAADILDAYFEAGGVYLDTSPTYGFGAIEEFLGEYLSQMDRSAFAISTSCGYVRVDDRYRVSGKRSDVMDDAADSLRRLRLDYFDVYISHIPDPYTPLEETAAALQALKDRGIAKRVGVSNVTLAQYRGYANAAEIEIVQNRLSFVNRPASDELDSALLADNVHQVAYQVIERGLLTQAGPSIRPDDLRSRKPEFESKRVAWLDAHITSPLRKIADQHGVTVETLAIGWALAQPQVSLVQIGATNTRQARTLPSAANALSEEVLDAMESVYRSATETLIAAGSDSIEDFLGLRSYDIRSGSATGK